ncbi:MAG TPA: flagellar motor switch protein FliG [Alphaproteobacteria bacterium]
MAQTKTELRELRGPQKAAIIMFALDEERAAKLFGMMDLEEIKELSSIMSQLGNIAAPVVENLFLDFVRQISGTGNLMGSFESTERLLRATLDTDRVEEIMEELRGPAGRTMWDKLGNVNEQVLANYLKNEYPQTVAVVLSKVKPAHASRVLGLLPDDFGVEVVMRMLRMELVQKDVLEDVERTLRSEFMSNLAASSRRDSHELMAEIFNNFDRASESRFLQALEDRDHDAAERIKALMFTFEDLKKLEGNSIQTLLREIDKDRLGIALKGASEDLRNLFFTNMSERAAKILREDMEALGPVRLSDVEEAQQEIIITAKDMAARGDIVIAGSGEDELVY